MNESELTKPIGTKEPEKLTAGSVIIEKILIEPPKEGSKAKLACFYCKHPDKEETIRLSGVKIKKIQGNNENIKKETLWWNEDDEGNIRKNSALAEVMRFYHKQSLNQFIQTSIATEHDSAGWLCIKAY
jgi:hypothetical protein